MELNGISAIVTGGASGLGAATARALAGRGAKVVLADLDRQQDKGDVLAKEIGGAFVPCNVTDTDQVIAAVEAAKELGPLRALVTAAGFGWATRTVGRDGEYASAHDLGAFQKVIEVIKFRLTRYLEQQPIGKSLEGEPLYLRVSPDARWRISGEFGLSEDQDERALDLELTLRDFNNFRRKYSFESHIDGKSLREELEKYGLQELTD